MNLALFDFDGTITHNDTFSLFLKFSLNKKTQILGGIRLAPYIAGYKLGWVTDKTIELNSVRWDTWAMMQIP